MCELAGTPWRLAPSAGMPASPEDQRRRRRPRSSGCALSSRTSTRLMQALDVIWICVGREECPRRLATSGCSRRCSALERAGRGPLAAAGAAQRARTTRVQSRTVPASAWPSSLRALIWIAPWTSSSFAWARLWLGKTSRLNDTLLLFAAYPSPAPSAHPSRPMMNCTSPSSRTESWLRTSILRTVRAPPRPRRRRRRWRCVLPHGLHT